MKLNIKEFHNSQGLLPIIQAFNKEDLTVDRVQGDPTPKRESGILTKRSTIIFKSGQKLEMRLNVNTNKIYQWRLNGMVLAIDTEHLRLDTALLEVIQFVRKNERTYKARQATAKLQKERVITPKLPTATMTLDEQIQAAKSKLEELNAEEKVIRQHIATQESINAEKNGALTLLNRQIAAENERSKILEAELSEVKKSVSVLRPVRNNGIYESAGSISISPLDGFNNSGPPQKINIEIDDNFEKPADYRGIVQAIEAARSIDRVTLRINSNDGNMQAAKAMHAALMSTPAFTKATIISAATTGSIVAMSCDSIQLTPFCSMTTRNISSEISRGPGAAPADHAAFQNGYLPEWFAQLYAGFLTGDELKDISKGEEIFLTEDSIRERLKSWNPIRDRVQRDGTIVAV